MEIILGAVVCLLLSAVVRLRAFSHCISKSGYANLDSQCQVYCAEGRCPDFCKCADGNVTETCAKLDFGSNNSLAINETIKPGTPLFTIQIEGQERWSYTLGRGGPVDGSVWSSLSKYLKLTRIGNRYEMIVDVTPDLEAIFQRYGVKLASLTLSLACERDGFPRKDTNVLLQILPVNEFAPEFFVTPLTTSVFENTRVGTKVYLMMEHTLDLDVNPTANEMLSFALWEEHLADAKTDGRAYFEMADSLSGDIQVKAEPDFELLQSLDAVRLYLNVSASDAHGLTSFTTLTVDIQDVDDLPPGFQDPSCMTSRKPCVVSYQASVPRRFQGQIINISPGPILARDMDGLDTPVTYSLKAAQNETTENLNKFYINATTGNLFLMTPFEVKGEVHLIVEAREVSQDARASQVPLHVTVDDIGDAQDFQKLDSSYWPGSSNTSSNSQPDVNLFMVTTIAQSALILLLLTMSLVLCAKLKMRSRTPMEQPPEASDKPWNVSSYHLSKDLEHQTPSGLAVTAASSSSIDRVTNERNCIDSINVRLFNDRNDQNAISELPSMIPFPPSTHNNWIRRYPCDRNVQISASPISSIELERTISLRVSDPPIQNSCTGEITLSNCPNTGCSQCGKVAYPNYTNTMRTNILAVSNSSYMGKLLVLSNPPLSKANYKENQAGSNTELLYTNRNPRLAVNHLSCSETESTHSDMVRTLTNRNLSSQVTNIRMPLGEKSGTENVDKKYDNIIRESNLVRKRFQLLNIQSKTNVKDSIDDCRPAEKESDDDDYTNKNSMSDDNTESFSERHSTTPRDSHRDVSSPIVVSTRSKGEGKITQPSLSLVVQQIPNMPLPQVEMPANVAGVQQEARLMKNGNKTDNEKELKVDADSPITNAHKMTQCCLEKDIQSQSIDSSKLQTLKTNTESTEHQSGIVTSPPSLFVTETMVTNKILSGIQNESKQSETVKEVRSVIVGRPMVSSLSSSKSQSKYSSKETNSKEENSQIVATSGSFLGEFFAAGQSRPHTSDAVLCTNKPFSSTVVPIPRVSTSAPTRRKRRTKRRPELAEVSFHRTDCTSKCLPERLVDISHSSCEAQRYLAYDVESLNTDSQQRHSWSLNNLTYQHQSKLYQAENHESLQPCDHSHYWPPEYQQVYMGRLPREQPYILLCHQEPAQCSHGVLQHQRLPAVAEDQNRHLHHPDDCVVATQDGNNKCDDKKVSQRLDKKGRNKKRREDPGQ
ncbi:hypothetical protein BsWGS_06487 [Bradybaena similaris]